MPNWWQPYVRCALDLDACDPVVVDILGLALIGLMLYLIGELLRRRRS